MAVSFCVRTDAWCAAERLFPVVEWPDTHGDLDILSHGDGALPGAGDLSIQETREVLVHDRFQFAFALRASMARFRFPRSCGVQAPLNPVLDSTRQGTAGNTHCLTGIPPDSSAARCVPVVVGSGQQRAPRTSPVPASRGTDIQSILSPPSTDSQQRAPMLTSVCTSSKLTHSSTDPYLMHPHLQSSLPPCCHQADAFTTTGNGTLKHIH